MCDENNVIPMTCPGGMAKNPKNAPRDPHPELMAVLTRIALGLENLYALRVSELMQETA